MSRSLQFMAKRLMDASVAALSLVLLLPAFALIAIAIKCDSHGPVFFVQERVGRLGRLFQMLKFRSMVQGADRMGSGFYVALNDLRITRVGRFLRRFSLDELPQLLHVLAGQMSLVGPRPALPYQVKHYSPRDARRVLVRPGITGWSQVSGRNLISWPERLAKDVWYVENFSLLLDLRILFRTPAVWWSGSGIYAAREKFFFTGRDDIPLSSRGKQ
jgi:undecaprenyl phosphate N,N'-diacetylbacillosamine 1-phosphate transferase